MKTIRFFILAMAITAVVFAMPASSRGQEIAGVSYAGQCGEFTVTVTAEGLYNLSNECWDAKLDVPGRVFDPSAGEAGEWGSSFYYVEQAVCPPEQEAALRLRPSSISPVVDGTVKLRQGNTVIERPFTIEQDCPQPLGWEWVIIAAAAFIIFFGYLLVWWFRQK